MGNVNATQVSSEGGSLTFNSTHIDEDAVTTELAKWGLHTPALAKQIAELVQEQEVIRTKTIEAKPLQSMPLQIGEEPPTEGWVVVAENADHQKVLSIGSWDPTTQENVVSKTYNLEDLLYGEGEGPCPVFATETSSVTTEDKQKMEKEQSVTQKEKSPNQQPESSASGSDSTTLLSQNDATSTTRRKKDKGKEKLTEDEKEEEGTTDSKINSFSADITAETHVTAFSKGTNAQSYQNEAGLLQRKWGPPASEDDAHKVSGARGDGDNNSDDGTSGEDTASHQETTASLQPPCLPEFDESEWIKLEVTAEEEEKEREQIKDTLCPGKEKSETVDQMNSSFFGGPSRMIAWLFDSNAAKDEIDKENRMKYDPSDEEKFEMLNTKIMQLESMISSLTVTRSPEMTPDDYWSSMSQSAMLPGPTISSAAVSPPAAPTAPAAPAAPPAPNASGPKLSYKERKALKEKQEEEERKRPRSLKELLGIMQTLMSEAEMKISEKKVITETYCSLFAKRTDVLQRLLMDYPFLFKEKPMKPQVIVPCMKLWEAFFSTLPEGEAKQWRKDRQFEITKYEKKKEIREEIKKIKIVIAEREKKAVSEKKNQKIKDIAGKMKQELDMTLAKMREQEEEEEIKILREQADMLATMNSGDIFSFSSDDDDEEEDKEEL